MINIRAKKSLGQNFLHNKSILNTMVKVANIDENDLILEIGPGTGSLTNELLKTKAKIVSVEADNRMEEILNNQFKEYSNFKLVIEDIRKYYPIFLKHKITNFKIVANIPYYLSSFLFRLFFENTPKPTTVVLMTQKELAMKIAKTEIANNKLRMYINLFFETKYITTVKKQNFKPQPKVDSAIIALYSNNKKYTKQYITKFEKVINAGFRQPRKMLISNLKNYYDKDITYSEIFSKLNINIKSRPEELNFETWTKLIESI
jgi:16S rRNA (adenine1518-N6/adenine1519-N6)-dimethyltransferase